MKLVPVFYFGFTAMDKRFSRPMLPWIVSEIRKREYFERLSVGVEDGCFQAYNADFELQFSHRILQMTRFSQADLDPCTFLYLLRDESEQLLYCYLFQATQPTDVLHVIDRVLAPVPSNISSRGRKGMDFIASEHAYSYDFEVFHSKLVLYKHLRPIFNFEGPNTYFLPIDVYITSRHLRKLDDLVVRGHIVVGNALFTRATPEGVVYKTACDGSYVQIRVRLVNKEGSMFVASDSYSVNNAHDTGVVLAKILVRDIPLQNGVLHIIDRPLGVLDSPATFFPYLPMYYKISGDPTLNISYHLIKKAGWEELLKINDTQLTFFVPQDSAYSRLKPRYMDLLFENAQEAIGRHLVLSANPYSVGALIIDSEASPLHLKAFSGTLNIGVTKIDEDYWVKWKLWTMKITRPDYECTNGVVHIMNGLFLDGTDLFRFGSRS